MDKNQRENFYKKIGYFILILVLISLVIIIQKYSVLQSNVNFKDKALFQIAKFFPKNYPEYNPVLSQNSKQTALSRIQKSGVITIITQNSPHSYYKYKGKALGFEYELAQSFAKSFGVKLQLKFASTWKNMLNNTGKTHFITANLCPSISRSKDVDFSHSYLTVKQNIIFHKNNTNIQKISDLAGKTIHVPEGTAYEDRLKELQLEGLKFNIKTYKNVSTEELIRKVAQKEIEVTVANSHIAYLNRRYYPDAQIGFSIKENQPLAWAVPKREKDLLTQINLFFKTIKENGTLDKIFERYYADIKTFDYVDIKKYHHRLKTRLPKYESIIKTTSKEHNFDWRLIAAQIYQESHFNPKARSFSGVRGIMQVTLITAKQMGVKNRLDPYQSITAGVKYLRTLYKSYDKSTGQDRILISLAAYNVGPGHILDAQKIARRMNLDPYKWSSLKKTLPLLSDPQYYRQSAYGYCRGFEPVDYVQRIMTYYDILKQKTLQMACSETTHPIPSEG